MTLSVLIFTAALALRPNVPDGVESAIDALVAPYSAGSGPGVAVAVLRDGKAPVVRCAGLADLESGAPIVPGTRFYVASLAKQFTAACALLAERDGKLKLDDPIGKVVPALSAAKGVTLQQLVRHTGGMPDLYEVLALAGREGDPLGSNAAALAVLAKTAAPWFEPGSRFSYSNSGYLALAAAIGVATKEPFPAYARRVLFAPLGMNRSLYRDGREARIDERAFGYRETNGGFEREAEQIFLCGPGGLFTALDDLVKWDAALRSGKFGGAAVAKKQLSLDPPRPGFRGDPRFGPYAFGLMVVEHRGLRVVRHGGKTGACSAELMRFDDPKLSVIVLSNHSAIDALDFAETVADAALTDAGIAAPVPGSESPDPPDPPRAGFYASADGRDIWLVRGVPGAGGPTVTIGTIGAKFSLAPGTAGELRGVDVKSALSLSLPAEEDGPLTLTLSECEVPLSFLAASPRQDVDVSEIAGRYRHRALGTSVTLRAEGARLLLEVPNPLLPVPPMVPLDKDLFVSDAVVLRVARDAGGKVTGFKARTDRAGDQEFERTGS